MNAHRVMVLGVVAVVAIGAALWSTKTRKPATEDFQTQPLIAGLQEGINQVSEVRVRTAGDALQATMRRSDTGWVLAEKENHAVDVDKLSEYLLKLARAKRVEAKTDNPTLYERLGVEEMSAKQAQGAQIEIDGLGAPVKLIIGHNITRGGGTYVRDAGQPQSWQADADLAVEKVAANWLQRDLTDIAAGRIMRVDVAPAKGGQVRIVRGAGGAAGDFALANLPKGREPASEFVADGTAGFLSGLRFDDVLKAADNTPPTEDVSRAVFATEEGVGVDVTAWTVGDKTYAQFSATFDEAAAAKFVDQAQKKAVLEYGFAKAQAAVEVAKPDPAEPEAAKPDATKPDTAKPEAEKPVEPAAPLAVTDAVKDREERLAALRSEMTTLNIRFADKTFVLPSFKAGNLGKTLDEYLKPKS